MNHNQTYQVSTIPNVSAWKTFSDLVKFRLNLMVVFSAVLAAVIASEFDISASMIIILALGGFLVTGAANILNQVLERDYDKLMKRTAMRPLATGNMKVEHAVLIAGFMCLFGVTLLGLFNPLTALLGVLSMISYAFVYTPMKRYSPWSAIVGAVPGALPVVIGCAAIDGSISLLAIVLFAIQFLWQLPHFWAIAWLGDEDYKRAGFQLLPNKTGLKDQSVGKASFVAAVVLLLVSLTPIFLVSLNTIALILIFATGAVYTFYSYELWVKCNAKSAKQLMFMSFAYLPIVLIVLALGI